MVKLYIKTIEFLNACDSFMDNDTHNSYIADIKTAMETENYMHLEDICEDLNDVLQSREANEYALELLYNDLEGYECEVQYAIDMGYYVTALDYANKALEFIADNNLPVEHKKYFEDVSVLCW